MALYTSESKDRVRDAVDMVELVSARTELRRAGPSSYEGLCPDFNSYVAETSPFAATHLHTQVLDLLAQGVAVEAENLGGAHLVAACSR